MRLFKSLRASFDVDRSFLVYTRVREAHKAVFDPEIFQVRRDLLIPRIHPEHLVVLHENTANDVARKIGDNLVGTKKTLVNLNAGPGLIAKHLIKTQKFDKCVLMEPNKDFHSYLEKLHEPDVGIQLVEKDAFRDNCRFEADITDSTKGNLVVHAILPWNRANVFLDKVFADYSNNTDLFDLDDEQTMPELFLIVPEFVLAQLSPEMEPEYKNFNSSLSVLCALLIDMEMVATYDSVSFFPYPLDEPLHAEPDEKKPKLTHNSLYLVKIKFLPGRQLLVQDKRLFHAFIKHLWSDPNRHLFDFIAPLCEKKIQTGSILRGLGLSETAPVRKFHSFELFKLYKRFEGKPGLAEKLKTLAK
jgi:16S rRNA A1518/A1519 N6-dimethyltransferase RsmA/KsgA/DIM1 with predicted DNA glycosylase/AP lyase activity